MIEDKAINMKKVKQIILEKLKLKQWPLFLIEWHQKNLQFNLKAPATIAQVINNVQKNSCSKECACQQVYKRLKEAGFQGELPTISAHCTLFF